MKLLESNFENKRDWLFRILYNSANLEHLRQRSKLVITITQ